MGPLTLQDCTSGIHEDSGDAYTHHFDKVTVNVRDCARVIDDSILFKPTVADMFNHMASYLTLCGRNGILQNKDKFVFCRKSMDWASFRIGPDCVSPLPAHTEAIRSFPTPRNVTDLRSFMTLVNQVSVFHATQPRLLPFPELLKKDSEWYWDGTIDSLFRETKTAIASEVEKGITAFDPAGHTCLLTDWSKSGLGYVLIQKHCPCADSHPHCCPDGWKVCGVGSRFTSSAEANGLEKTKYFTLGCSHLIVGTDHKPLVGVFKTRSLDGIANPRLRRLKEKTFGWHFEVIYVPGRSNGGPDALSR